MATAMAMENVTGKVDTVTREVELGNAKYNLESFLELFQDEKFELLTLKAPIKYAYRIISLSEQIKRNVTGIQTNVEMVNFLDEEGDRRLNSKLLIKIHRKREQPTQDNKL